jgi:hypothetical protein
MRVDPTPFMQPSTLTDAQSRSRLESIEARKAFAALLSNPNQRPVPAEEARSLAASARREQEVSEARTMRLAEAEKDEEPTPSPDPSQRPGRVLDIRV